MAYPMAKMLADARRASGMSVLELADRTGYCESFIQKLECGARTPALSALMAWSEALGYELVVRRKPE